MWPSQRLPLAWLNLTHDKRRLSVCLAGIAFAVVLMFMELGFWHALLDSMVGLIERMNADIIIVHKDRYNFTAPDAFTRRRLSQAQAVDGVIAARPLYIENRFALWNNPEPSSGPFGPEPALWPIRVIAYNLDEPLLDIPEVGAHRVELQLPDTVLFDRGSKRYYGARATDVERELAQRNVRIVGTFRLGTDFVHDGNLILSADNFAALFPRGADTLNHVDTGIVTIEPGRVAETVREELRRALPGDVDVFTKREFAGRERAFWQNSSPVGFVFGLGVAMGFLVGVVICYQILSADVADHQAEYATFKAMGYSNSYLTGVILQEALWLSLLGFVPGLVVSLVLYALLENATGLPLRCTLARGAFVLVLTLLMCFLSGIVAVRKVQQADPADVFR